MSNSCISSDFTLNRAKNCWFFTQNHEKLGKLSFAEFTVYASDETLNHIHAPFTYILIITHHPSYVLLKLHHFNSGHKLTRQCVKHVWKDMLH